MFEDCAIYGMFGSIFFRTISDFLMLYNSFSAEFQFVIIILIGLSLCSYARAFRGEYTGADELRKRQ